VKNFLNSTAIAAVLILSSVTAGSAQSADQPVIDAKSIEQLKLIVTSQTKVVDNQITQIANQDKQIKQQLDQITKMDEQLTNMKSQLDAITGTKDVGLISGGSDPATRKAADSLKAIADGAISGAGTGGRLDATITDMKTKFDVADTAALAGSTDKAEVKSAGMLGIALAAAATGEDEYIRSNEAMDRVDIYIKEIDKTKDLKASVDLNTRVLTEILESLNESVRADAAVASVNGAFVASLVGQQVAADKFLDIGNINK
jgi:type IV secretion system protein VirB5